MTDTHTLDTLSKMTMIEIMEKMNKQEQTIKMLDEDAYNDVSTINKLKREIEELKNKKPKKTRIKGTKKELVDYLDRTEEELLRVFENVWSFSDRESMEHTIKNYENEETKLRPTILKDMREIAEGMF
tara:strand:- start:791 stop:1174 length:384 start_codon:yes stop_codon:yes gene_type:complete